MFRFLSIQNCAYLTILGLMTLPGLAQKASDANDVATILALSDEYGRVFTQADLQGYLNLLAEDAMVLPASTPTASA